MAIVLLADDDPDYRDAFAVALEAVGHRVTTVASGAEVKAAIAADLPDIVFLDVLMPGGGAISLIHEIHGTHPGLPVVVITGNAAVFSSPIVTEGMRGADARIPKSVSLGEISQIIDSLLARTNPA
ncbi:response regulator [Marinovum sp.]|uniref:response regulator n=1 Tax=Marinovum sp. TaxID=2024839 RepID=UPI002B26BCBB|nr:response regulator [Marinovum sp.]